MNLPIPVLRLCAARAGIYLLWDLPFLQQEVTSNWCARAVYGDTRGGVGAWVGAIAFQTAFQGRVNLPIPVSSFCVGTAGIYLL